MLRKVLSIAFGLSLVLASQAAFSQVQVGKQAAEQAVKALSQVEQNTVKSLIEQATKQQLSDSQRVQLLALLNKGALLGGAELSAFAVKLKNGKLDANDLQVKGIVAALSSVANVNDGTSAIATVSFDTNGTITSWEDAIEEYPELRDVNLTDNGKGNAITLLNNARSLDNVSSMNNAVKGTLNFTKYSGVVEVITPNGISFLVGVFNGFDGVSSSEITTANFKRYSEEYKNASIKTNNPKILGVNKPVEACVVNGAMSL